MSLYSLISTLQEYHHLGIPTQIGYKKQCLLLPQMSPKAAPMSPKMSPKAATYMLTPRQQQILQMMQTDGSVSASTMAVRLGITIRTIRRDIETLRKHYTIRWIGSSKQGHWQILPQNVEQ